MNVVASDDGVNASDPTATGEQAPGAAAGDATSALTITGGTVVVDADGDGLDANGFLTMTGGTVVVNGPTNDGNGALDVDGTFDVSGGTLLAAGVVRHGDDPGAGTSASRSSRSRSPSAQAAGTVVHVLDADGTELAAFESSKDFSSLVYASPTSSRARPTRPRPVARSPAVGGLASGGCDGPATPASTPAWQAATARRRGRPAGMGGPGERAAGGRTGPGRRTAAGGRRAARTGGGHPGARAGRPTPARRPGARGRRAATP